MPRRLTWILIGLLLSQNSLAINPNADWYHIEIILFAINKPTTSGEIWPLNDHTYPVNMISIGNTEEQSPYTLDQLKQILAFNKLTPDSTNELNNSANVAIDLEPDYLFADRSRFKVTRDVPPAQQNQPADVQPDTMSGQNSDLLETTKDIIPGNAGLPLAEQNLDQLFQPLQPQAFLSMPAKNRLLNKTARRINRSSLYRLLKHDAWLQPIEPASSAAPILIQTGYHYDDRYEIDGTITISRSRFLHFDTDLRYTAFSPRFKHQATPITLDLSAMEIKKFPRVVEWESKRGTFVVANAYKMVQSRRMRSSTLHYVDHPFFGILIQAEKYKASKNDNFAD